MTALKLYGITNCSTVKKARVFLETRNVEYHFHDFRKHGFDEALLNQFLTHFTIDQLLNKRGMTWRKLTDDVKNNLNADSAKTIMLDKPTIIKRPIALGNDIALIGFDEEQYDQVF